MSSVTEARDALRNWAQMNIMRDKERAELLKLVNAYVATCVADARSKDAAKREKDERVKESARKAMNYGKPGLGLEGLFAKYPGYER